MKSLCIKTNNTDIIKYLLNELKNSDLKNICFSENQFKNYKNIIIHYTGNDVSNFFSEISSMLCFMIIDVEEESILKQLLSQNYFYFDVNERNKILSLCFEIMAENFPNEFDKKFDLLYDSFYEFISSHKSILINGFINFRLNDYKDLLDDTLNEAVNQFIIEKEYSEFVSLLKLYVGSQAPCCDTVHLIYSSSEAILLDENKNLIVTTDDIFNAKYLSDISFSSNDYALNTLLNLLPKNIYVHLINGYIDEFINTIRLVFENRVHICTDYEDLGTAP